MQRLYILPLTLSHVLTSSFERLNLSLYAIVALVTIIYKAGDKLTIFGDDDKWIIIDFTFNMKVINVLLTWCSVKVGGDYEVK